MKKIFVLIGLIGFVSFISPVLAAETATPSVKPSSTSAKTQDLLDRVTTKVAELTNQLRRTYSGKVKSLGNTSITLTTSEGERAVATNDVTSFFRIRSGNRSEISFSALKAGDDLVATGTVDPQNNEMTAIQIVAKVQRYNIVGNITDVNKGVITVQDFSGKTYSVDLNDAITLKKVDQVNKIQTAKITDFQKGNLVFVIGYLADSTTQQFSTLKALVYPL